MPLYRRYFQEEGEFEQWASWFVAQLTGPVPTPIWRARGWELLDDEEQQWAFWVRSSATVATVGANLVRGRVYALFDDEFQQWKFWLKATPEEEPVEVELPTVAPVVFTSTAGGGKGGGRSYGRLIVTKELLDQYYDEEELFALALVK